MSILKGCLCMEKFDMTKLDVAIRYVERIAEGLHPVSNLPVEEETVLNNPNVIRCMYFVKEILEEVRRNDGVIGGKRDKRGEMMFPMETLDLFQYQEDKSITQVLKQIYAPVEELNVKRISAMKVNAWLKEEGYLEDEVSASTGKSSKVPTEKGKMLGLYVLEKEYNGRPYQAVLFDRKAQEFLVEKMRELLV